MSKMSRRVTHLKFLPTTLIASLNGFSFLRDEKHSDVLSLAESRREIIWPLPLMTKEEMMERGRQSVSQAGQAGR